MHPMPGIDSGSANKDTAPVGSAAFFDWLGLVDALGD